MVGGGRCCGVDWWRLFGAHGYLGDTTLVATAFEWCCQEGIDDLHGEIRVDETGGEHQYIGVVVGTGKAGEFNGPADGGAYALMLVEGHGDTVAAATHGYTHVAVAALNGLCAWVGEIRIIAALLGVGSEVGVWTVAESQVILDHTFEFITGMVAAYSNLFFS